MNKKLILFDIDGTIVSYKGKTFIPQPTIKAIKQLKQNGHILALASGRSLLTSKKLMERLEIYNAVLHNGARIIINNKTIFENKINAEACNKLCGKLLGTSFCVFAFDRENIYVQNITDETRSFLDEQIGKKTDRIKPLNLCKAGLYSINIYGDKNEIPIDFNDFEDIEFNENLCEISAAGVSKGNALTTLAKKLNKKLEDTIAVGDGLNDIDMLKKAGCGIAVGNASDNVKNAADLVTGNIEEGGIFEAFRKLNLI